jgi:hypothetical protein
MITSYKKYCQSTEKSEQEQIFDVAIKKAKESTLKRKDGEERMRAVDMVLISQTHTYSGASFNLFVSDRTITRWINDFVYLVGKEAGYERQKTVTKQPLNDDIVET